jgi:phosphocarrier protein HPr
MSTRTELVVSNPSGLHARPAARFVELARSFEADISIEKDGVRGNGKSLVGLLRLGISKDAEIAIEANGADEDTALAQLSALLADLREDE